MEFSSLVTPEEWAALAECFRAKRAHVEASPARERFRSLWAEWELEAACRFTPQNNLDRFRLVREAVRVPPAAYRDRFGMVRAEAVQQLYAGGVSVSMANLEYYSNLILALSRSLERELQAPVQVSFYATPGSSQALGVHSDGHDVLVIQMRGEKRWDIYYDPADPARDAEKPQRHILHSGGWLFVPTGMRHEVKNEGSEPSVHLTVGFHPLKWGLLFEQSLARAVRHAPGLLETIPPHSVVSEGPEAISKRLLALLPFIDPAAQSAEFYRDAHAFAEAIPQPLSRAEIEAAGADTRFTWHHETATLRSEGARLFIDSSYRRAPLELRLELEPILRQMGERQEFRAADVTLPDAAHRLLLCKFLAHVGALRIRAD